MSITLTIRAMKNAGCTLDQVLAVVEAFELSEEVQKAERRAKDAERQRKSRATRPSVSRDVTVTTCDRSDQSPQEKAPQTPKKENPQSKENPPKGGQKKGFPLSADWAPNSADWAEAVRALGQPRAEGELAKFRDYWPGVPGEKGRKLDWDGTWRNWVRKAAEFAARASPRQQHGSTLANLAFPELRGHDDQQHSSERQSREGPGAPEPARSRSDRDVFEPGRGNGPGTLLDFRATGTGWS